MDERSSLEAIEQGIRLWWRAIGRISGFEHHAGDIEWVLSPGRRGPERIFNVRIEPRDAAARVDGIAEAMKSGLLPGGMLLTPLSTPDNIAGLLTQRGLVIDDLCPCMTLDLAGFTTEPPPRHVEVAEVMDDGVLCTWAGIVNRGLFGCELFTMEQYRDLFAQENIKLYIASLDGLAASACMTIHEAGVATLECVATLPECRHRGLAHAAVSHALAGLKGCGVEIATLRSELDGIGLYQKLGFGERCKRLVANVL